MSSLLLKNGTVLFHEKDDTVTALRDTDVLVEGDTITGIGRNISAPNYAEVIDCTDKIVSPGFIDCHRHTWQTQLRGRHTDHTLFDYIPRGNAQSVSYTPEDVYWGQLGGCLESINAGTTFILDHSHLTVSSEYPSNAISATVSSGIRSIYAYVAGFLQFEQWDSESIGSSQDFLPGWSVTQLEELCHNQPFGDGRVQIGLGFDFWFLPKEVIVDLFSRARKAGTKLITSHVQKNPILGLSSVTDLMKSYDLLSNDICVSHGSNLTPGEYSELESHDIYICCTPYTEAHMALGPLVTFNPDVTPYHNLHCLGADCHSANTASIISAARSALMVSRQQVSGPILSKGKAPRKLNGTTHEAFNLATINGARAVKMATLIGSIALGKKADLVVIDGTSPGMVAAYEMDPVTAVVRHSDSADCHWVIINGKIRKSDGKLVPIKKVDYEGNGDGKSMEWPEIRHELVRSRAEIQKRIEKLNMPKAEELFKQIFYIQEENLI